MAKSKSLHSLIRASGLLGVMFSLSGCIIDFPSSSSSYPSIGTYTVEETAAILAKAASQYGDEVDPNAILTQHASELSSRSSEVTFSDYVLLGYYAFQDRLPERIKARKFQGYDISITDRAFSRIGSGTPLYQALSWYCDYGLIAPTSYIVDPAVPFTKGTVRTLTERFHTYFGTSAKDDFFAAVNHDFLYGEDAPDVGPDEFAYESNLIPQSRINDWCRAYFASEPESKAFYETFIDVETREDETLGGLVTDLNTLLDASDIAAFISALKEMVKNRGYCPLWSTMAYDGDSITNGDEKTRGIEVKTYDGDFSAAEVRPGSSGYTESVERFTPIFRECLGVTTAQAKIYAANYTKFKYHYAQNRSAESKWEGKSVIAEEDEVFGDQEKGLNLWQFLLDIGIEDPSAVHFSNGASNVALFKLFDDAHLAELKGMAIWQMLEHFVSVLPNKPATMAWAHSSGTIVHDAETLQSDDIFTSYVIPNISANIAASYYQSDEYAEDAALVYDLVKDIKAKFATRVSASSWLSAQGKEKVSTKLDSLISFVSTAEEGDDPYDWGTTDFLTLEEGGTAYLNVTRKERTKFEKLCAKAGTKWDGKDRNMAITEVMLDYDPLFANAFYVPWENGIVISLGYLAAYKRPTLMSQEEFLASYGWVVGHEISHGFDSTGIYYDENGTRLPSGWLPSSDISNFKSRAADFADYYSGYEVMVGQATKGDKVLAEAIADVTGLNIAIDIGATKDGFNYLSFFQYAASNFGAYASQSTYSSKLADDEHPFGRARVNAAFGATDKFHETLGTTEEDGMYVDPAERPKIW